MKLFEAKLNKGQRILWEVAVSFSERRSKYGAVFTDVIRVWSVIEDHDDIDKHVSHVEAAHARGLDSKVKHQLETTSVKMDVFSTDSEGRTQRLPRTYSEQAKDPINKSSSQRSDTASTTDGSTDDSTDDKEKHREHYHLASANKNEYALLKFYAVNSATLRSLLQVAFSLSTLSAPSTPKNRLKQYYPIRPPSY